LKEPPSCGRYTPYPDHDRDLQADAEGIIRNLPEFGEAIIVSADGEMIATLTPIVPYPALTPEQIVAIKQSLC